MLAGIEFKRSKEGTRRATSRGYFKKVVQKGGAISLRTGQRKLNRANPI